MVLSFIVRHVDGTAWLAAEQSGTPCGVDIQAAAFRSGLSLKGSVRQRATAHAPPSPPTRPSLQLPDWARGSPLEGWREVAGLGLLNLKYDAMPADFVSVVSGSLCSRAPPSPGALLLFIPRVLARTVSQG